MKTSIATLLGAQCGVLAAHWLGRRWGALPVGLLLGCLVAGGATLRSWQVLSTDLAAPMLDPVGSVLWANACFAFLLVYIHDGSPRVRSLFLGCLFVFAAVGLGHWTLIHSGAASKPGIWPLVQCAEEPRDSRSLSPETLVSGTNFTRPTFRSDDFDFRLDCHRPTGLGANARHLPCPARRLVGAGGGPGRCPGLKSSRKGWF